MHEIRVPRISDTLDTSSVIEWLAKEKDKIEAHQAIAVLESDKVNEELLVDYGGILHIITPENVTIPLGHLIAILADNEEEYEQIKSKVDDPSNV